MSVAVTCAAGNSLASAIALFLAQGATLPDAVFREVPGTHMSSVTKPAFGEAISEVSGRIVMILPSIERFLLDNSAEFSRIG